MEDIILEWILLLEIQTNCKKWVGVEKSVEASIVFTLLNSQIFNSENVKKKEYVHTWANTTQVTLVYIISTRLVHAG